MNRLTACLSLALAVAAPFALTNCASSAAPVYDLPALDRVGDFISLPDVRVETPSVSFLVPEGWNHGERDGVAMAMSPPARGAEVRVIPVDRSEAARAVGVRPEHCPAHYARCTPIEPDLVTHYGVVRWRQTVWIDNGEHGAFRLETRWNGGIVGRGVPSLVGLIARSARIER